ncbi:VanZ family protein [Gandjariella thermophila]|uniref:VanZ-like domain-containing protein n=1 Tax=Gandjariella thermophila TaxID=1931992 RepID=A0A4D4IVZ7_9PSEU|nr:VanZ family protein [Gandjariella thermophila]GDY28525.1 hypothetical protein GTS_01580 [Gandjariella thermophila]
MDVLEYARALGEATPWLWPGVAVTVPAVALLARPAGRVLGARAWHAGLLLLALAGIALVTLTPSGTGSLVTGYAGSAPAFCILHADPPTLLPHADERTLNVALFVPAGLAVALLRRRRVRAWALVTLAALPVLIEACQFLGSTELGRSCQVRDVVQNLTGAAAGAGLGLLLRPPLRRRVDPADRGPGRRRHRDTTPAPASDRPASAARDRVHW